MKIDRPGECDAGRGARKGQALVEYALILVVVVVVIIVALTKVGEPVNNMMSEASDLFPPTLT